MSDAAAKLEALLERLAREEETLTALREELDCLSETVDHLEQVMKEASNASDRLHN